MNSFSENSLLGDSQIKKLSNKKGQTLEDVINQVSEQEDQEYFPYQKNLDSQQYNSHQFHNFDDIDNNFLDIDADNSILEDHAELFQQEKGDYLGHQSEQQQYIEAQELQIQQQILQEQNNLNNNNYDSDSSDSYITAQTNDMTRQTTSHHNQYMKEKLSEKTQKIITNIFSEKICKYGKTVFNNVTKKEADIKVFEAILKKFKFSYRYDRNHQPRKEVRNDKFIYDPEYDDQEVDYLIHDMKIQVFFLKVNPVTVYCNLKHNMFIPYFLEELDSFLRETFGSSICIRSFNHKKIPQFQKRLEFSFMNGLNDPPTQFIIRCGKKSHNTMRYLDMLIQTYAHIIIDSKTFEKMACFLCFWGLKRKILCDEYLSEYALFIMLIYFCQMNNILPVLHESKKYVYQQVTEMNKKLAARQINLSDSQGKWQFKKETKGWKESDFFIFKGTLKKETQNYNDRRKYKPSLEKDIAQLIPLDFPKNKYQGGDKEDEEIINNIKTKQKYNKYQDSDLGMLVTKFFYTMAYEVPELNKCITIDGKPEFSNNNCAGYSVINPILRNNLTEHLAYKTDQYNVVQNEFDRAFLCISGQKTLNFQDLCTAYKP